MVQNAMHQRSKLNSKMKSISSIDNAPVRKETADQSAQQQQEQRAFFQLAGHKECFKLGTRTNTILKKSTGNEERCFKDLLSDSLSKFVPNLIRTIEIDGQNYLEMEDLLSKFENASVMDVKMGLRTYREEEIHMAAKEVKLRHDMYEKMIETDANEPTEEEKKLKAITKPRYMIWRETISSTSSLGFRIEGMRFKDGSVDKEFKTMKHEEQIIEAMARYVRSNKIRLKYLKRLHDLKKALMESKFFSTHEVIGSSLLFVHDDDDANIWLIDFAKTDKLPENTMVTHRRNWELGNHEDGYLVGIDNLTRIFEELISRTSEKTPSETAPLRSPLRRNRHPLEPQMSRLTCVYGR